MIALVLLAGVAGALVRFFVVRTVRAPWAVLAVNVAGSFVAGLLIGSTDGDLRLILLTGFCGGLTTYSSFMVQSHDRGPRVGAAVVVLTVVPALLLCGLGFWLGTAG